MAATGDISREDMHTLRVHLEECVSCRGTCADMAEIHAKWLPEHPNFEIYRERGTDLRHREAILKALDKEGVHFSRAARKPPLPDTNGSLAWPARRSWMFVAAGIMMFCVGTGLTLQVWRDSTAIAPIRSPFRVPVPVFAPTTFAPGASQGELERKMTELRTVNDQLREELKAEKQDVTMLQEKNASRVSVVNEQKQQLAAMDAVRQKAEAQLNELRSKQDAADAIAFLQETEIQNLNRKLAEQATSFERERQLLSLGGREVRDLIAARNLHIIDVYDTNSRGKTSPSFGRIFYTEGKSLIFYAYDLSAKLADNGKTTFYVWGKRDSTPHDVKGLGVLIKDDHVQRRWVFATTDTKVLASIDSIFVTIESTEKPTARPGGKPLLNAFLGTAPNHP